MTDRDRPAAPTPSRPGMADEALLDAAFAALTARPGRPSGALVGRVLADAAAVQPRRRPGPRAMLATLVERLGLPVGLAAALAAGVWIGTTPPEPLQSLTAALFGATVSLDFAELAESLAGE